MSDPLHPQETGELDLNLDSFLDLDAAGDIAVAASFRWAGHGAQIRCASIPMYSEGKEWGRGLTQITRMNADFLCYSYPHYYERRKGMTKRGMAREGRATLKKPIF